jgi:predicted PurR-regulated permease PerM
MFDNGWLSPFCKSIQKNKKMEHKLPHSLRLLVSLACISIIIWWMSVLQEILVLLLFSVLFAMLLYPLCNKLEKWRFPRTLAIFVCLLITFAILAGLVMLTSAQIADFTDELPNFQKKAEILVDKIQSWASDTFHISRKKQVLEVRNQSLILLKNSGAVITNTLSTTANSLANMLLIPIFVFFFLHYRDFFRQFFYKIFHKVRRAKVDMVFHKIYVVVQSYLAGLVIVIGIVATLNTVGLLILGIDYAVFFGVLAAFLLLIPYIGIMIGSLLPIVMALITKDSPLYAVGVAGVFIFVQFLEGNFITPQIVGSKVSVNPLAAMLVLILGGQLWGISGLVLAIPLTAIIKVIFDHVDALKPYGFLIGEAERKVKSD